MTITPAQQRTIELLKAYWNAGHTQQFTLGMYQVIDAADLTVLQHIITRDNVHWLDAYNDTPLMRAAFAVYDNPEVSKVISFLLDLGNFAIDARQLHFAIEGYGLGVDRENLGDFATLLNKAIGFNKLPVLTSWFGWITNDLFSNERGDCVEVMYNTLIAHGVDVVTERCLSDALEGAWHMVVEVNEDSDNIDSDRLLNRIKDIVVWFTEKGLEGVYEIVTEFLDEEEYESEDISKWLDEYFSEQSDEASEEYEDESDEAREEYEFEDIDMEGLASSDDNLFIAAPAPSPVGQSPAYALPSWESIAEEVTAELEVEMQTEALGNLFLDNSHWSTTP